MFSPDAPQTVYRLTGPQRAFMDARERFVLLQGAVRSGKSTIAMLKVRDWAIRSPGIQILVTRWKDSDLGAILKPLWRAVCADVGLLLNWRADEECDELPNGSRVYLRSLKSSEDTARYSRFRGLTLACVAVDQCEEVPEDIFLELKARLSQPGFPHQMMLVANPPDEDHWLAQHFPEGGDRPDHRLIVTSVYDNRAHIGDEYIRALEAAYPEGHPKRRPLVEGLRGVSVIGQPVYGGYFARARHVRADLEANAEVELLEGIDFGAHRPAVVWAQFQPWGALHVLGAVMGEDLFLEDFVPLILDFRRQWFPQCALVWTCCDPAGATLNSQGTRKSAVDVLRDMTIFPRWVDGANHPNQRNYAIHTLAGYMRRETTVGQAFLVNPRCMVVGQQRSRPRPVLVTGFEVGYVWDARVLGGTSSASNRRPLKAGGFDHCQNALEYIVLNFAPVRPTPPRIAKHEAQRVRRREQAVLRALRVSQHDSDPYDRDRRSGDRVGGAGRGGY